MVSFRQYRLGKVEIYKYIVLALLCLIGITGCQTVGIVNIVSNPSNVKFAIYDKNGNEVKSIASPEVILYDWNKQRIQIDRRFPIYARSDKGTLYDFYYALPASSGRYTVHVVTGSPILNQRNNDIVDIVGQQIFDAHGRSITGERTTITNHVTPQRVKWQSNYDYIKFELTGYPTQKVKPTKSGDLIVDLTKGESTITAGQRGTTSTAVQIAQSSEPGIEQTISKAVQSATPRVPKNSIIAVVPITATDTVLRDFVTSESEFCLVEQGFSVVDRAQLDRIRTEQRLQLSGEIDSNTISSIGRFSGADYIVTGQIDGSGSLQRLRLQVLEVQTADVVGTASEQYGESPLITNPKGIYDAVQTAIVQATTNVSQNSRLAIVEVTADSDIKSFITGEAEYLLKNKGFRIVDRAQLDRVRAEQSIQHSNEFDDKTVANIGKLAGADYLITIRVDGKGGLTRLRWRILNTQSALVAGAASVHFTEDTPAPTTTLALDKNLKPAIDQATTRVTKDTRIAIVQFSTPANTSANTQGSQNNGSGRATLRWGSDGRPEVVQNNSGNNNSGVDNSIRSENVVYSLENELVTRGFRVVDRSQLDTIRAEQRYQRSGEVDSRTAVDIGKFAGARYIVTGSIDGIGSLQRFRLRVLDTETAEVVGVASVSN